MKTADPRLSALLENVRAGTISIQEAEDQLRLLPYEDLGYARLDHHRKLRLGYPEVVFAQGKTAEQVANIMVRLAAQNERVLATRAVPEVYTAVRELLPDAVYHAIPRLIVIDRVTEETPLPGILVATGGTADMPVAEEAAITAELMGNKVVRLYDVGVAGIHRLFDRMELIHQAKVIVVAAGMEGALASVVAGLVGVPVVAVPTSVGYGASFGGLSALLGMLNSCAPGVSVVNIDNGFGAGHLAGLINRQSAQYATPHQASQIKAGA